MQVSNDDLALILGRMEGKLDGLDQSSKRQEAAIAGLDKKLSERVDAHDLRLRELEVVNPKKIGETVAAHEERIRALENGAAKAGVIAGVGSSIGIAVIIELVKRKLGL